MTAQSPGAMPFLLVRHAVALRQHDWSKPDALRPLTPRGLAQAEALVAMLSEFPIARILSSPSVRCVETVEPLAMHLGLAVEENAALAEGAGAAASRLDLARGAVVMCSHGDVIPDLLAALAPGATRGERDIPCAKGSTWVVEIGQVEPSARYLDPPDVT